MDEEEQYKRIRMIEEAKSTLEYEQDNPLTTAYDDILKDWPDIPIEILGHVQKYYNSRYMYRHVQFYCCNCGGSPGNGRPTIEYLGDHESLDTAIQEMRKLIIRSHDVFR